MCSWRDNTFLTLTSPLIIEKDGQDHHYEYFWGVWLRVRHLWYVQLLLLIICFMLFYHSSWKDNDLKSSPCCFSAFFCSLFSLVSFICSFIFLDIASIVAESSHYCKSCERNSVCWLIADLYLQPPSGSWWSFWGCCGRWSLPYIFLLKVSEHVCNCHDWTFQSSNLSSDIPVILGFSLICLLAADMISEGILVTFFLGCYLS